MDKAATLIQYAVPDESFRMTIECVFVDSTDTFCCENTLLIDVAVVSEVLEKTTDHYDITGLRVWAFPLPQQTINQILVF
jgi:hypothetical protein